MPFWVELIRSYLNLGSDKGSGFVTDDIEEFKVGSMRYKGIRKEIAAAVVFHSYSVPERQDRECTIET